MKSLLLLVLMPWRKSLVNNVLDGAAEGLMLKVLVPVGGDGLLLASLERGRAGRYCYGSMSAFAMLGCFRISENQGLWRLP